VGTIKQPLQGDDESGGQGGHAAAPQNLVSILVGDFENGQRGAKGGEREKSRKKRIYQRKRKEKHPLTSIEKRRTATKGREGGPKNTKTMTSSTGKHYHEEISNQPFKLVLKGG